ncbi:MAG: hypothetical protein PVJ67_06125 [Candidatus Pacearchaeota archaeon]|jgi:hypothetical protein
MDKTLSLEEETASIARENGFKKVSDKFLFETLIGFHKKMVSFVGERYNQKLTASDYFNVSKNDFPVNPSLSAGHTIAGWACVNKWAAFFNRTKYYDSQKNIEELIPLQMDEVITKFGHEAGHVFTPLEVIKKMEADKKEGTFFNYIERFADDFSWEFEVFIRERKIENESCYKEGSLVLPN